MCSLRTAAACVDSGATSGCNGGAREARPPVPPAHPRRGRLPAIAALPKELRVSLPLMPLPRLATAVKNLEASLADQRRRALVQMASGGGKTHRQQHLVSAGQVCRREVDSISGRSQPSGIVSIYASSARS